MNIYSKEKQNPRKTGDGKRNCCLHEMIGLAADAMLRMAGKRIATPVCGLVRNDTVF